MADGGLLLTAVLVKPLPLGGCGQDGTVLGLSAVGLRGPEVGRVPVFVCDSEAGLIHPGALCGHVIDAQPDLRVRADAVADVVSELVVLVAGCGRAEDAAQRVAVFTGSVIPFPQRLSQEALVVDLYTFQTD